MVVSTSLSGGGDVVPACDLDSLGAAAAQLVEDMEDQQVSCRAVELGSCICGLQGCVAINEDKLSLTSAAVFCDHVGLHWPWGLHKIDMHTGTLWRLRIFSRW
jgi:hypothetical protein